jgi:DNA-binding NarL/FixJ family response regulator
MSSDRVRVLVVDDDTPTRVGLRVILTSEPDIDVVGECASVAEAVTDAATIAPDVILMDVQLRDGDGIQATEAILQRAAGDDHVPKVIVLTTFELDEYAYGAMRVGASGFLLKRSRAEDIVAAVRAVNDGAALPMPAFNRTLISRYTLPDPGHGIDLTGLTDREEEVLVLIAEGLSNAEIADRLTIRPDTVKSHVKHVFSKLGVRDRAQAVIVAYESGIVLPGTGLP